MPGRREDIWSDEQRAEYRRRAGDRQRRNERRTWLAFVAVVVACTGGSWYAGKVGGERGAEAGRAEVLRVARAYAVEFQRATAQRTRDGCERGKVDRAAIAKALRAQSTYLNGVLAADSVRADVKRAAARNQNQQDASASDLESRTGSRLDCTAAFPLTPLRLP